MPSGNGGQIAFAKVASLYSTVNTINIWANFSSETLEHKLAELSETSINGRRDQPNAYKGIDSGAGDIVIEPNPNFLGHLLTSWYGSAVYTSSTVCGVTSTGANSSQFAGAQVNYHRFQPSQTAWSGFTYLEPYNVMVYRDVGSAWLFQGSIIPSLKFDLKAGALLKVTATVMARQVNLIQRTAAIQSLVSSGGRPWVWDQASVELSTDTSCANLAAATNFEELTLGFDLPHTGVTLLNGTKNYGEFQPSNFRTLKIDGTMSFRDQASYLTFKAYEAVRLRATLLNVNSLLLLGNPASADQTLFQGYFGLRFHVPSMIFTSWSAPMPGPNRISVKFAARAQYSESEGFSSVAELINVVNSAAYTTTY
jgi:hypothetical protein